MNEFEDLIIQKTDTSVIKRAKRNWNSIAKPLGSLGRLEELVIQLAGIFADENVRIDKRCALIACADNGIVAVLLNRAVEEVTGRGAGLTSDGLHKKIAVIKKAIKVNNACAKDEPILLLSMLGGYDIAAMTGMFLGGAVYGLPILIDGVISSVAALLAYRLVPASRDFMIASHVTEEPAGMVILEMLGLKPVIHAGMYLGEGTGAVCLLPLLDIALHEYWYAHIFADTDIAQYEELK